LLARIEGNSSGEESEAGPSEWFRRLSDGIFARKQRHCCHRARWQ